MHTAEVGSIEVTGCTPEIYLPILQRRIGTLKKISGYSTRNSHGTSQCRSHSFES